ncbi:MAG: phosphoribosylamine--glycine ligase [Candidatus Marinimicrobia bacterium]|nr:phosphoribosylamine--glycine ligase [Candidatus Neomarinimicrobiota bacterium]RPG05370.1 MAG: phosphoribosylamine--glycine ligase [Pelagibacteraceae bacterium TMED247]|tara:strand:- start:4844 stop:6133 length:1290 start_codon:yes stop_codon:yes gene_type:complete
MNLAVIGSGGREHALCYKLRETKEVKKLLCIPGNAGTQKIAKNINENLSDFEGIYKTIKKEEIDIVIVGPEEPLVNGIIDFLEKKNIKTIGPDKFASQLEGSKAFMKNLCKENDIPTANFGIFEDLQSAQSFIRNNKIPIVVKADGLAAGKGVSICKSEKDAINKTKEIIEGKFQSSKKVVLEEFIEGEELSYFVAVDKNSFQFFGSAQDHKKVGENDTGPNTGGMGAYSPANLLTKELNEKIKKKIINPTLKALKKNGHAYKGFLYAGLMIKNNEPYLIEYNIRMGDPECQVLMMRLKTSLLDIIKAIVNDKLESLKIHWDKKKSMTIVLCSKGYPGKYKKNIEIKNLNKINSNSKNQIFHAGTYSKGKKVFSNGGRVLNITSCNYDLNLARRNCLENLKKINWNKGFFRKDIGWRVIGKNENNKRKV